MDLIPTPASYTEVQGGSYVLPATLRVSLGGVDPTCLTAFAERTGRDWVPAGGDAQLTIIKDVALEAEAYNLGLQEDGVHITASGEAGVVNALTTLVQLMEDDGRVPFCVIEDSPRYAYRGLMLDVARNFMPVAVIKAVIEQMALVKLNALHLHLSDDQGFRVESRRFPRLHEGQDGEYYTQEDIAELISFASARNVDVIPEIDMPGHSTAILAAYPHLSCSGRHVERTSAGGIFSVIMCAGNEQVYDFIEELLDELCPLFSSRRFHIGGDEAPKREWVSCHRCQERISAEGLHDEKELQGHFTNRVIAMLKQHGKQAICWNDVLDTRIVDRDALIQYWTVQYADLMPELTAQNGAFIYSDMFRYYIASNHGMIPMRRVYESGAAVLQDDYSHHPALAGIEACIWGGGTPEELYLAAFPRTYALAEKSWSTELDYERFKQRLTGFLARHHPMACTPLEKWDPTGRARQDEVFAEFRRMEANIDQATHQETQSNLDLGPAFYAEFIKNYFVVDEDRSFIETVFKDKLSAEVRNLLGL